MQEVEYKVVAAPRRIKRIRGVKGPDATLAQTVADVIDAESAEGWRYLRADTLQVEEKGGLFSGWTVAERSVLVFERPLRRAAAPAPAPAPAAQPQYSAAPPPPSPHAAPLRPEPEVSAPTPAEPQAPGLGGVSRD